MIGALRGSSFPKLKIIIGQIKWEEELEHKKSE